MYADGMPSTGTGIEKCHLKITITILHIIIFDWDLEAACMHAYTTMLISLHNGSKFPKPIV